MNTIKGYTESDNTTYYSNKLGCWVRYDKTKPENERFVYFTLNDQFEEEYIDPPQTSLG